MEFWWSPWHYCIKIASKCGNYIMIGNILINAKAIFKKGERKIQRSRIAQLVEHQALGCKVVGSNLPLPAVTLGSHSSSSLIITRCTHEQGQPKPKTEYQWIHKMVICHRKNEKKTTHKGIKNNHTTSFYIILIGIYLQNTRHHT